MTGFQSDLGAVSAEIETLQVRSASLTAQLENRRVVEKLLGPTIEDLSLAPDTVLKISEGPIDESWIRALSDVDKRVQAVKTKSREGKRIKAVEDLEPLLENIVNRVCNCKRINHYV